MKRRYKIIAILSIVVILGTVATITVFSFMSKNKQEIEVLESIEKYGYNLDNRDNEYFVENFEILKDILNSEEIDLENYAKQISILFITDLYSINNKTNKYDVGGYDYVYSEIVENYKSNISDTMYKYIGNQDIHDLPEVKSVKIESINEESYSINEKEKDVYEVLLSWEYYKDLGYETTGKLIILKEESKLSIIELSSGENNE